MSKTATFPAKGINRYVSRYINDMPDLSGRVVVDIPCGDGRASYRFREKGATVRAFDLYPEFMKVEGISAEHADMSERLPIDDASADYVICQEGIEHVPDQVALLTEFNRILKPGGRLFLTTPNVSHFRTRLAMFLTESTLWRRMPASEIDSVWFSEKHSDRVYYGHLFLVGAHHLHTICKVAGFEVKERVRTKVSATSVILGVFFYPVVLIATVLAFVLGRKKVAHVDRDVANRVLWEHVALNVSPRTLFCKHMFWVLEKKRDKRESVEHLKKYSRDGQQA
jgi:SAM-dependent methyltransferase